jgi:hypothetical protein
VRFVLCWAGLGRNNLCVCVGVVAALGGLKGASCDVDVIGAQRSACTLTAFAVESRASDSPGLACVCVCACRNWHCGRVCGVTFSTLCKHMMDKGVVTVETKGYTVMVR